VLSCTGATRSHPLHPPVWGLRRAGRGVEVSHDLISLQGLITHELRLMLGINPVSLLAGVAALAYVK